MKRNNKITPQVYKELMSKAKELPELQKYFNGKPLFQVLGKQVRTFTESNKESPNFGKKMKEDERSGKEPKARNA